MSNLCMMIASSTSLGMYPSERMAMPSSCLEMNPLPSRSRTLNASRISAKTNKCATQHLKWLPIIRPLIGRPPLSNDCNDLPLSLHLLLHQWRHTLLCCFSPQNACQLLILLFIWKAKKSSKCLNFNQPQKHDLRPGFFLAFSFDICSTEEDSASEMHIYLESQRRAPSNAYFINNPSVRRKLVAAKDSCFKIELECHISEEHAACSSTQQYIG